MFLRHLLVLLCLSLHCLAAETYKVGDTLAAFACKDQHEKSFSYEPGAVRVIAVSYEMGVGKDTNGWLAKQPLDFLGSRKAVFLADIYPMPGIGRAFALPKMRKYPHQILLADEEKLLERHPRQKGRLTVFLLDEKGVITEIRFVDPEKEIAKAFAP